MSLQLCKKYHEETELLIKTPPAKESFQLYLTFISAVPTGVLRGNDGPQHLLCGVGMSEVAAHILEVPCKLESREQRRGHQH